MPQKSVFSGDSYLKTLYDLKKRPLSDYPLKLASFLTESYAIEKKSKLLDVGCGRGDMLKAFSELGYEAKGLDLSPLSLELCAPNEVRVANFEKEEFPYETGQFNTIFSKSVIEHLHEPINCFSESNRVLKAGGLGIFMTPSWKHNSWGPFYHDHTHVTPFTRFSLHNIMEMSGFTEVKVLYFYQLPFLWKHSYLRFIPKLISMLPVSYWPAEKLKWNEAVNKFIRFSNEVMLIGIGKK